MTLMEALAATALMFCPGFMVRMGESMGLLTSKVA